MTVMQHRYLTSTTQPFRTLLGVLGCVVLVLFQLSCGSVSTLSRAKPDLLDHLHPPRFSMIFIIHGDGGYLYHNNAGLAVQADEDALTGAIRVAVRNPEAEVFIFHEKPKKHVFIFFPLPDGKFYYYRHGRKIVEESYRRNPGSPKIDQKLLKYQQYRTDLETSSIRLFLYFGHEIPDFGGKGYNASYADRTFTVHNLADELKVMTCDSSKFDIMVLSTCFNGSPHTIEALSPYVRTIIASPENLHLSYFDLRLLERLDIGLGDRDISAFAEKYAFQSFRKLTENIQTSVAVAVYDVDRVRGYLQTLDITGDDHITSLMVKKTGIFDHYDCAEDSVYFRQGMNEGVTLFYRPAHFGRFKDKQNHSGWCCSRPLN
jgi:hypothetical protein